MPAIYHIATVADWNAARQNGEYEHPSLVSEGFIHCSLENQVPGVLERYFSGRADLLKLTIDTDKLTRKCIYELSQSNNETFPHIYGTINMDAVTNVEEIKG